VVVLIDFAHLDPLNRSTYMLVIIQFNWLMKTQPALLLSVAVSLGFIARLE